jgi:hypothetical protein
MNTVDWNGIKIRASAIHKLMVEPKSKEAKAAGLLSETAKTYLKEVYVETVWGLSKDIQSKFTDKGKLCEEDGLTLLSRIDKVLYIKNTDRLEDDWFTGTPDAFKGESLQKADLLIDNKCSWNAWTFIDKLNEPLDPMYEGQMQVYLHLAKCTAGRISYTLVDTPDEIIIEEERRLSYQMGALTTESPDFKAAKEYLWLSSKFSHIPIHHRHIGFPVQADPEYIEKAKSKVEKARQYIAELHEKHMIQ